MEKNKEKLISIFATNNNELFVNAKSILTTYKIEHFPTVNSGLEIKVFEKDKDLAKKLIKDLQENNYLSGNINRKTSSAIAYLVVLIILAIVVIVIANLIR